MAGSFIDTLIGAINNANNSSNQQEKTYTPSDILAKTFAMIQSGLPQQGEIPDIFKQITEQPEQQEQPQINEYNPYQATYYADPYSYEPQAPEIQEPKKSQTPQISAYKTPENSEYPAPSVSDMFDSIIRFGADKAFGAQAAGTPSEDLTEDNQQTGDTTQQTETVGEAEDNTEQTNNSKKASRNNEDDSSENTQSAPNIRIPIPGLSMTQDILNRDPQEAMQNTQNIDPQVMQNLDMLALESAFPSFTPIMQAQEHNPYNGIYLADPMAFDPMVLSGQLNTVTSTTPEVAGSGGIGQEVADTTSPKTQRELFVEALANNRELNDYYRQNYGVDLVGDYGYEWYRYLPSNTDASSKRDLVRDLYLDPSHAIAGWDAYLPSMGVDRNAMSEEDAINAILNYMWSPENMIDISQYLANNNNYRDSHLLGSDDAASYMGRFLADNQFKDELLQKLPSGAQGDFFDLLTTGGKGNNPYKLDSKDLGNVFMASNLKGKEAAGLINDKTFTDKDLARLESMLQQAGDNMGFYFTDENDPNAFKFEETDNPYIVGQYLEGLPYDAVNYGKAGYTPVIDVYNGVGNEEDNLASAHLADDIMALVKRNTGKSIARKPKNQ